MPALTRWHGLAFLGIGLGCYLVFLLITLPAYWADWLLNRATHNVARIQSSEGTLWSGVGTLILQSTGQERLRVRMAWGLQPLRLFTGKLQIHLRSQESHTPFEATFRVGYRQFSLHEVDATLPIGVISAFNPAVELVAPSGRLHVTSPQATLTADSLNGELQLTWQGAGARLGGLSEIGDYRLLVNGRGATAELRVETLRGDVNVTGQGEWRLSGEGLLQLTGTLTPGNREENLRPLLAMINAQNNNGQYSWILTRRFPPAAIFGATPAP